MRIHYNAPVTLTYAILSGLVLWLSGWLGNGLLYFFVAPPSFNASDPTHYFKIVSHTLGHADIHHYLSNFMLLLLLGPLLEEKYGSKKMLILLVITSISTGILNAILFDHGLLGASGNVFMMIVLSSFTGNKAGKIPLTFLLVVLLYLGQEIINGLGREDQISQFAHLLGGMSGAIAGFAFTKSTKKGGSGDKKKPLEPSPSKAPAEW